MAAGLRQSSCSRPLRRATSSRRACALEARASTRGCRRRRPIDPVELRGETRVSLHRSSRRPDDAREPRRPTRRANVSARSSATTGRGCCRPRRPTGRCSGRPCSAGRRPERPRRGSTTGRSDTCCEEGTPVPFLVELGVMTPDGKVRKSRYDKFRQVNRFLELVDDVVPSLRPEGTLRVVDFGCGKSYLTFAIHHLLTELRGRSVEIVGLDLKEDVIAACASFAERSGAAGLRFERGDIASFEADGGGRSRRQPARLRHRHRRGARAGRALAGRRDPRRSLLPEGGLRAARERSSSRRCSATASPRSASRRSSPTRSAPSSWSSPATARSSSSSSPLEHTAKNVLIRAVKGAPAGADARRAYEELRDSLGLDPALERLLNAPREDVVVLLGLRVAGGAAGLGKPTFVKRADGDERVNSSQRQPPLTLPLILRIVATSDSHFLPAGIPALHHDRARRGNAHRSSRGSRRRSSFPGARKSRP